MVNVRFAGLVVAAGVVVAACGGGGSIGTTGGGGKTTTSTHATTSSTASSGATTTSSSSGTTAMPQPPDLANPSQLMTPVVLNWTEPTPCDTVEIERQDMVNPYPATPQFSVPGTMKTYTDTSATQSGNTYFYRARCVVGTVRSAYGNEVSWLHP
jgi:hypothetical protein